MFACSFLSSFPRFPDLKLLHLESIRETFRGWIDERRRINYRC
jgi:hypothetical protein